MHCSQADHSAYRRMLHGYGRTIFHLTVVSLGSDRQDSLPTLVFCPGVSEAPSFPSPGSNIPERGLCLWPQKSYKMTQRKETKRLREVKFHPPYSCAPECSCNISPLASSPGVKCCSLRRQAPLRDSTQCSWLEVRPDLVAGSMQLPLGCWSPACYWQLAFVAEYWYFLMTSSPHAAPSCTDKQLMKCRGSSTCDPLLFASVPVSGKFPRVVGLLGMFPGTVGFSSFCLALSKRVSTPSISFTCDIPFHHRLYFQSW